MTDVKLYPLKGRAQRSALRQSLGSRDPFSIHEPEQKSDVDRPLLYVTIILSFLGLMAVFSASATEALDTYGNSLYFVQRQLCFFVLGYGLVWALCQYPVTQWLRRAGVIPLVALGVIGLLLFTMVSGVEAYGAERWVRIAGIQFQPSEFGKLSVVLLLAQALGRKPGQQKNRLQFLLHLGLILVTLLLIYKQPSLSMTIILATTTFAMFFVNGVNPWALLTMITAGGGYIVYKLMHTEYQLRRIQGWLNPWKDPQDTGYNLIQSLYAIGSGGLVGTGLGMSHQKLYYLPFQYTDFIFSVWAEEWGFLGCLVLLGLFVTLLYRGMVIVRHARGRFDQFLAMAITFILSMQLIVNVAVATGLFPVTGVTLPLISYGGTSVLVTLLMIGLLLNISRQRTL